MPTFIVFLILLLIMLIFLFILSREKKKNEELFHIMAHKLRSSISIIKWYTELLSDKSIGGLNDKQKKYFDEICKSSEKLNNIIDSLAPKRKIRK